MNHIDRVDAIMARYQADQGECSRQSLEAAIETGARLRHLLLPILHRWGMGMLRGGALLYMNPNGDGSYVEMGQDYDYALQSVISAALWTETGLEGGDTLHNYVKYIPLPTGQECVREYVWIVTDHHGDELYPLSFDDSRNMTIAELSGRTYHGPVSLAYYEDMLLDEDPSSFMGVLPKYRVCVGNHGKWVRITEASQPTVPSVVDTTYTLRYGVDNPPVRDVDVYGVATSLRHRDVYTSTGAVVEAAITLMVMGTIPYTKILIEGVPIINENGALAQWDGWPSGYYKRLMVATLSTLLSHSKENT